MIGPNSPLRNLPVGIGAEQAFFFDGMRHAAELCELSYNRLTKQLSELSHAAEKDEIPTSYAAFYLDAWAFVDSCDKYVGLWIKQPQASTFPTHFSPETVRKALQPIRQIRNISDHLASNKNRLLQLNSASFGILSWITFFQRNPPPSVRIPVASSKIVFKRGRTGADSEIFRRTQTSSTGQTLPTT